MAGIFELWAVLCLGPVFRVFSLKATHMLGCAKKYIPHNIFLTTLFTIQHFKSHKTSPKMEVTKKQAQVLLPTEENIAEAARSIRSGSLVGFPTETGLLYVQ